jgi:GH35 family endo-1,4-beta-xylanase
MNKKLKYFIYFLLIVFILLAVVFCFFFIGKTEVADKIDWGVDFSQMQAESLGLDWKQAYLAIINDLGAKNIKLHTQWDWIEGQKEKFYFEDTDWQLSQAENGGVKIIYVVGVKSGRWPECHIPDWAGSLPEQQEKKAALNYIKEVVERYKDNKAIKYWQVENEPLFNFGKCPSWYYDNKEFLKQEVDLVRSLDSSRQIIISDSGEGSMWLSAAEIGDIVGTTMYRKAWAHISNGFGFYFHYFFSPVFYTRKALLVRELFGKKVINVELQAEPWASVPFNGMPLSEQYKTMDPEIFKSNVEYAKQTGFDTIYFWGVEWWYWLKTTQNQPEIWNEAKTVFSEN